MKYPEAFDKLRQNPNVDGEKVVVNNFADAFDKLKDHGSYLRR